MRTQLTIGAAALIIVGIATDAEARGRRGRSSTGVGVGVGVGTSWTSTPRNDATARPLAAGDLRMRRPELESSLRRVLPVTAPAAPAAPIVRDAGAARPWCESGRVVGSGAGFCAIN
jgi:hypothetical protein